MIQRLKRIFQLELTFIASVYVPKSVYIITRKVYLPIKENNTLRRKLLSPEVLFTLTDKYTFRIIII